VIGDPASPHARAAHVVTRAWPDEQLRVLLQCLATRQHRPQPNQAPPSSAEEARDAQRAITAARKLAAVTDLAVCESTTVEILVELLEVDRAYLLYYDHNDATLWSQTRLNAGSDDRRAVAGLAGFAARTGVVAIAQQAGADPRFVGEIDDPNGDETDRLIAQPVYGADGLVHAVLVGARRGRRPPFGPSETMLLARFARLVTPVLDQLSIQVHAEAILDDEAGDQKLFRRAAIEAQAMPRWGDVVRVSPGWLSWAYWLLVVLLVGSGVFLAIGTVSTYSTGPAVIRSNARTPINARAAGNIVAVDVAPGDPAVAGTVIARFDDTDQRAAVERLEREFETQLRNHMLDPADAAADTALRTVRNNLETARTALGERVIRATTAGIVGDVRVRYGQHVEPGDIIASVIDSAKGLEVIALLPGEDRPQLAPGMAIRLELTGYRYAYQTVVIDSVSSDVIAPAEARRVLGAEVADGLQLAGPVMVVRGKLAGAEFDVDGTTYRYHDGMIGTAEVRVRSEPIVYVLAPGTRRFR
jgi:membrane fusion protein (multidrug efflux system)